MAAYPRLVRTVVHNVLVGSVSFASPGAKALHNASTAQEITVISPTPHNFQFRVRVFAIGPVVRSSLNIGLLTRL